jgi:DNA-binding HxlR family transcriptional regulator
VARGAAMPSEKHPAAAAPRALKAEKTRVAQASLSLDRLIHERVRLGILSALAVSEALSFNDLKRLMKATDGNLSVHARKLEEAQLISCEKTFEGRVPRTDYRLTTTGRKALERYLDHMESLIRATREK